MPQDQVTIGSIALLVGLIIRLIKTDKINSVLEKFKISIPKEVLPFLAIALGIVLSVLQSKTTGVSWGVAFSKVLNGLISGAIAIAGNETLVHGSQALFQQNDSATVTPLVPPVVVPTDVAIAIPTPPVSEPVALVVSKEDASIVPPAKEGDL
jgi:hypothetical protein